MYVRNVQSRFRQLALKHPLRNLFFSTLDLKLDLSGWPERRSSSAARSLDPLLLASPFLSSHSPNLSFFLSSDFPLFWMCTYVCACQIAPREIWTNCSVFPRIRSSSSRWILYPYYYIQLPDHFPHLIEQFYLFLHSRLYGNGVQEHYPLQGRLSTIGTKP